MSTQSFASFSVPLWGLAPDSSHRACHLLLSRHNQAPLNGQLLAGGLHFVSLSPGLSLAVARPAGQALAGYLDEAGNWVIEPQFEAARAMAECGLARFEHQGLWGYVAGDGRIAVEPRYKQAEPFSAEGLAAVTLDYEDWHYINAHGETAIPGPFRRACSFAYGLARVIPRGKTRWRYIDIQGRFAFSAEFDLGLSFGADGVAPVRDDRELWGLVDRQGQWVLPAQHDDIDPFNGDGLAAFRPKTSSGFSFLRGYLDARGRVVVEPVDGLEEQMIAGCARLGRRRFVNAQGQPLHEGSNTWAERFSPLGVAFVLRDDRWGLLDKEGRHQPLDDACLEPMTDSEGWIEGFGLQSGLAPVLMRDGSVAHIDVQGRIRFKQVFVEGSLGEPGHTVLCAVDGQVQTAVWQSEPGALAARPQPFLMPQVVQFATSSSQEPALSGLVQQLAQDSLKALELYAEGAPRSVVRSVSVQGHGGSCQDEEDEEDDADDRPAWDDRDHRFYSRSYQLARAYLGEECNGYYDSFLARNQHECIQSLFETVKQRLIERWGPSDLNPDCEYPRGIPFTSGAWVVGDAWVLLQILSDSGDGDTWTELWLEAFPNLDQVDVARRRRTAVLEKQADDESEEKPVDDRESERSPLPATRSDWVRAIADKPSLWNEAPDDLRDDELMHAVAALNLEVLESASLAYLESDRLLEWVRRGVKSATCIPAIAYTPQAYAEAIRLYGEQSDWLDFLDRHKQPSGADAGKWDHNGVYDVLGALLTEKDCIDAARQGGALRHVPLWLRTPKVIQASLEGDIYNVSYVPPEWITPDIARRAVRHDYGRLIQHIPEAMLTEELCIASVKANASTLEDIPERWRTPAVCIAALDEHSDSSAHVPEALALEVFTTLIDRDTEGRDRSSAPGAADAPSTFWHFLRACARFRRGDHEGVIEDARRGIPSMRYEEDGHFLMACAYRALGQEGQAVKHAAWVLKHAEGSRYEPHRLLQDQDATWLASAVRGRGDHLSDEELVARLVDDPGMLAQVSRSRITQAMAEQAVRGDEDMVKHVPRRLLNPFLYAASVKVGHLHVGQVPQDMHSEDLFLGALYQRQVYLDEIPEQWRTLAVCVAAVYRYSRDMEHVPPALCDEVAREVEAAQRAEEEQQESPSFSLSKQVDRSLMNKMLYSDKKFSKLWTILFMIKAMLEVKLAPRDVGGPTEGWIGWLRARALQVMLAHVLLNVLALGLHVGITVKVWQSEGPWTTLLTGVGMGFAEVYWAWNWSRISPMPVGWLFACAGVALTMFGWNRLYRKVLKGFAPTDTDRSR